MCHRGSTRNVHPVPIPGASVYRSARVYERNVTPATLARDGFHGETGRDPRRQRTRDARTTNRGRGEETRVVCLPRRHRRRSAGHAGIRLRAVCPPALETNGEAGDTTGDSRPAVGPIPLSWSIYRATMTVPLLASQRQLPRESGWSLHALRAEGQPARDNAPRCRHRVALTKLLDTLRSRTNGRSIKHRVRLPVAGLITGADATLSPPPPPPPTNGRS